MLIEQEIVKKYVSLSRDRLCQILLQQWLELVKSEIQRAYPSDKVILAGLDFEGVPAPGARAFYLYGSYVISARIENQSHLTTRKHKAVAQMRTEVFEFFGSTAGASPHVLASNFASMLDAFKISFNNAVQLVDHSTPIEISWTSDPF